MRRILVLAAVLAVSMSARADVTVRSRQARNVRVRGDAHAYAVVGPRAFAFDASGPGDVVLVVRQVFTRGMRPGQTGTSLVVHQDGRRVQRLVLREGADGPWSKQLAGRPSTAHTLRIPVESGRHRFTVRVTTSRHRVALAVDFEAPKDDLALVPLVPLSRDGGAGAEAGDATEIPLADLTPGPKAGDEKGASDGSADATEIPLAALDAGATPGNEGDAAEIPLAGLTPSTGGDDTSADAVPLASLTPADGKTEPQAGENGETTLAMAGPEGAADVERGETVSAGGLVGAPLHGASPSPFARPGHGTVVLGLRALGSAHGIGGGTFGGGADVLTRLGPERRLLVGLSVDVLPYRLRLVGADAAQAFGAGVSAVPIMATAGWTFGAGALQLEATAGVGVVRATFALDGGPSGSAFLPGGAASVGVLYEVGPGALQLSARVSGGYGRIEPDASQADRSTLAEGPFGGLGVGFGYQIEL